MDDHPLAAKPPGDMSPEDFTNYGHAIIDWIAAYLTQIDNYPVLARTAPGDVARALPRAAPLIPESMATILHDFEERIVPGVTHWNHPGFFAYFDSSGSAAGILGETLTAALNVNAMMWRTSPAATELEEVAVDWLRQMLGLPVRFSGHTHDAASTSTLVAIAAAREATGLGIRDTGLQAPGIPTLMLYCSEDAHSSVERAAMILGLGRAAVRKIPTDESFRMRADVLAETVRADVSAGARPFCVVASIGTTSTTSVDPVAEIARICQENGLWLHVDAAYAGSAAVLPEVRAGMQGWEQADSIVVNPHKWLFVPLDCSVLFVANPAAVRAAFTLVPDYLQSTESDAVTNLMDFGPALGRRFRALKLWMTLRSFGQTGIAERIGYHLKLAQRFRDLVEADPNWEISAPTPFSTVCFRYAPGGKSPAELDQINEKILDRVNQSGAVFISHTRLRGRYTLRLAIGNIRSGVTHVDRAWESLRGAAAEC